MTTRPSTLLTAAVAPIPPISLEEMDSVKLLNRIDSKYLTNESTLAEILDDARAAGYRALEISGSKITPYTSVYYDTPQLKTFLDHHNKRLTRQKVRTRVYVNSGETFLEIKRKNNHGRTKKKRIAIESGELLDFSRNADATAYLAKHSVFTAEQLSVVLSTEFWRITLVNPARTERLTIDSCLNFENYRNGHRAGLKDAVIIELKQDGRADSQMKGILLDHRVKPVRVSKYCVAVTLTDSAVKHNRFKAKIRAIEKTINSKIETI